MFPIALRVPSKPYARQVALVAGYGAIGKALVDFYLQDKKWKVCVLSRFSTSPVPSSTDDVLFVKVDLSSVERTTLAVEQCVRKFGGVSVVVCCAGEPPQQVLLSKTLAYAQKPLLELSVAKAVSPVFRKQCEGSIVFLNSNLVQACLDLPGLSEFLLWGNAVSGLADGLCTELRQCSIRVSSLYLGLVQSSPFSQQLHKLFGKGLNPKLVEAQHVPLRDVVKSVDFLSSPEGINGSVWEMRLTPQLMFDRNELFTDRKRVEKMIAEFPKPQPSQGKRPVALVTGAGKGIGKGICLEMAKAGYDLIAIARTQKDLDVLKTDCLQVDARCDVQTLQLDVTNDKAMEQGVKELVNGHFGGRLHVVVSNAGTNRRRVAALSDMQTWTDVMDVDLMAAMNLTRFTIPHLLANAQLPQTQKPFVVFVSTRYAHPKGVRMPGISPYITAKAGTNAFSDTILEEVRDLGVGVLCFSPGTVATDLGLKPNQANKGGSVLIEQEYMLQPSDCGKAIVFAVKTLSPQSVVSSLYLESLHHGYPAIRKSQAGVLESFL